MSLSTKVVQVRLGGNTLRVEPSSVTTLAIADMRLPSSKTAVRQRSINLAMSSRGIAAIQTIDASAAARLLENVLPMGGRMIHSEHGNLHSQPYDRLGGQVRDRYSHRLFWRSIVALLNCDPTVHQLYRPCPPERDSIGRGYCYAECPGYLQPQSAIYRFRATIPVNQKHGWE
jgi:hypothetical protein